LKGIINMSNVKPPVNSKLTDQVVADKTQFKRIVAFDYFRAISIILIIIGHSYGGWSRDTLLEISIENLITGTTALFVFISGFFFHNIFRKKYNYKSFMMKKTKNVLVPYLLLTTIYILIYFSIRQEVPFPFELHENSYLDNIYSLFADYAAGRHLTAYWYIPFIMLIFLCSPLFRYLMHLNSAYLIALTSVLFLVSMYVQRPLLALNPLHSVVYFIPFYLFGIIYSMHKNSVDHWISNKTIVLGLSVLCLTIGMSYLGQAGNAEKVYPWVWAGFDLMVIQKVLLILFALSWLNKYEAVEIPWLGFIASISFALFFIHPWVLSIISMTGFEKNFDSLGWVFLKATLVTLVSIGLGLTVKFIFKNNSRFIVGY